MTEEQISQVLFDWVPFASIVIAAIFAFWLKEVVNDIVASFRWKIKAGFEPGDSILLDGEEVIIISIGYRETVFQYTNNNGTYWRYIENKRIPLHRLEKKVDANSKKV